MSQATGGYAGSRSNAFEVAHFFGEGDGRTMLDTLLDGFDPGDRSVEIVEQSYSNNAHDLAIKCRILQEDPPSVFVEWPGQNLKPYVEARTIEDISDLWAENGWDREFIDGAIDLVTFEKKHYGVPFTLHRTNNLFYNVELTERYGVDPTSIRDAAEFLEVLGQCADPDEDVVPMALPMKNPWTVLMLFKQLLVGIAGVERYEAIAAGEAPVYEREIRTAMEVVAEIADLASEHNEFVDMVEANQRFMDQQAVFFQQGDWVGGAYGEVEGYEYGRDWGHEPIPGTDGVYVMGMDSVVMPADPDHAAIGRSFLEHVADARTLRTINRIKGSIPPRRDVAIDEYPPFLQDQYRDFKRAREHTGGGKSVTPPENGIRERIAFSSFITDRDIDAAVRAIIDAHR
ncbi:MAG: ABC transporter substrate-binding protein [Halorhabdus sp.]